MNHYYTKQPRQCWRERWNSATFCQFLLGGLFMHHYHPTIPLWLLLPAVTPPLKLLLPLLLRRLDLENSGCEPWHLGSLAQLKRKHQGRRGGGSPFSDDKNVSGSVLDGNRTATASLFSHALHPPLQYSLRRISNKMILQELGGVKFTGSVVWDSGKAPSLQPPSAHCTKQQLQLALWVRCCKIKQDRIETLTPFAVNWSEIQKFPETR